MYHLESEIYEQPQVAARLLEREAAHIGQIAQAIRAFDPAYVAIAARGTSDNAGRYAQYLFGSHAQLSVALATPSLHTLYQTPPNMARALVIGISQSGQSEDVRRVIADARAQGALTVSITNDPASPLAQLAEHHIDLNAGAEISVAATKTYTAELLALAMLVLALRGDDLAAAFAGVPEAMQATLVMSAPVAEWAERYRYMERYAVIGRGYDYATAYEVSLKIKELCGIPGEEYSEADFRHGPIAVVQRGFPSFIVAPAGKAFNAMFDLLGQLHEKGAECLVISNDTRCQPLARQWLPIPTIDEWLSPLVGVIPGQLFAMHLAIARGNPVDQPEGLRKVTSTY